MSKPMRALCAVVVPFIALTGVMAHAATNESASEALKAKIVSYMHEQAPASNITVGKTTGIERMTPCDTPPELHVYGGGRYRDVRVSCPSQGWQLYVSTQVEETTSVVVASHDLQAGVELSSDDLKTVSSATLSKSISGTAQAIATVAGQTLTAPARTGTPIRLSGLNNPVSVHAGQNVNVHVISGRARIKTLAVAKQAGRLGQTILVENPDSGKRYRVQVTSHGLVANLGR